ncbi:hypothetical protein [Wenzhouxiangella sp. XN24]|uniref:hypothetical protein n=1 Tax=Wenzhouxiangella sp. XN24 TaxID=2713569 RepID=UPI0013EC4A8A|nr:hypothetical protein [Wenzhouxiangella sp. XN24]NGX14969.1 hypothetical protein [Wenzhouxiangella sp. XN24]
MPRLRLSAVLPVALIGLLPVTLQADDFETVNPGPDAAQISGRPGNEVQDIYPVNFIEINGKNLIPRSILWLEPGSYTIKVQVLATQPRPPAARARRHQDYPGHNVIELELEAGKTYEIRARFNKGSEGPPYSVILHRVDE